jgi:flavin reductase (DIM6/NTAB) family NADH-FMN oxidoreductase RutF
MDAETKKQVLRKMTYGMWVISAAAGGEVEASSVTWVTQCSFAPPLVAVCVRADTHLCKVVGDARAFAMHLLGAAQKEVAEAFTQRTLIEPGTIAGLPWRPGLTGAPILEGFGAWFEARITDVVARGDHTVFVAEVVEAALPDPDIEPLALATTGWRYGG